MSQEETPHGARYVYEILQNHVVLKVWPGLARNPKGQALFTLVMIVLSGIGGGFAGYIIYTQLVHPPLEIIGVCAPPAQLEPIGGIGYGIGSSIGCVTTSTRVNPQSNQAETIKIPSGYYLLPNGTRYTGAP